MRRYRGEGKWKQAPSTASFCVVTISCVCELLVRFSHRILSPFILFSLRNDLNSLPFFASAVCHRIIHRNVSHQIVQTQDCLTDSTSASVSSATAAGAVARASSTIHLFFVKQQAFVISLFPFYHIFFPSREHRALEPPPSTGIKIGFLFFHAFVRFLFSFTFRIHCGVAMESADRAEKFFFPIFPPFLSHFMRVARRPFSRQLHIQ